MAKTITDILGNRIVEELTARQTIDHQQADLESQRRAIDVVVAQNIDDLPYIYEAVRVCMDNLEEHYRAQQTALGHKRELDQQTDELAKAAKKLEHNRANTATVGKNLQVWLTADPELMAQHLNTFDHTLWPAVFNLLDETVKARFADGILGHIELHPGQPVSLDAKI
ncbi:MAG: hypothetical protein FOGNACKC_02196 [Anaerolineae bacterium]|nr:hypothetical protein [Anaerolineae bacterium]